MTPNFVISRQHYQELRIKRDELQTVNARLLAALEGILDDLLGGMDTDKVEMGDGALLDLKTYKDIIAEVKEVLK